MTTTDPSLRDVFVEQQMLNLGAAPAAMLPPTERRRRLADWLDQALAQVDDQLFGARFARACPVPGVAASAYQARILRQSGRATLLAGIRFKGGDVSLPFVDLLAWDRPLGSAQAWRAVLGRLEDAFSCFRPRWVRVRWPGQAAPPVADARREVDQWLVAGRLGDLQARPWPWAVSAVDVRPVQDLAFVDDFQAAHALWRRRVGPRGAEVSAAEVDELARCLETGAVVCAWRAGRWAGLAAAARGKERAMVGYEVVELFLDAPLRGQGRGPVLQRHLIDALPDHGRDALYGTIHGSNLPSLRTATRCGRTIAETWWFLRLGDAG